jgi:RES domain-containing protein
VITAWRIVADKFRDTAFDGLGAALVTGRWHLRGTRIVYTSESIALATLELLVNMERRREYGNFVLFACYFHEALIEELDVALLPRGWDGTPPPDGVREIGESWIRSKRSAVLKVPTAINGEESNYLLNPEHEDFKSVDFGEPRPFKLDLRLIN